MRFAHALVKADGGAHGKSDQVKRLGAVECTLKRMGELRVPLRHIRDACQEREVTRSGKHRRVEGTRDGLEGGTMNHRLRSRGFPSLRDQGCTP